MDISAAVSKVSQMCEHLVAPSVEFYGACIERGEAYLEQGKAILRRTLHRKDPVITTPLTPAAILAALRALVVFRARVPLDALTRGVARLVAADVAYPRNGFWAPPLSGAAAVHAP